MDQLVGDFQNRDIAAFEKLYEMYSPNIQGVIGRIVGNDEDAQEICQDVFVKVWDCADQYDASKGRFFTWLLNIARNAAGNITWVLDDTWSSPMLCNLYP